MITAICQRNLLIPGIKSFSFIYISEPRQNFAKQLTDQTIMEGGVATFSCEVVEANAKVVWCKNGTKIKPNKKYALSEKDKLFTLTIKDVTREDGGRYEAKVGENVMTAAVLNVQGTKCILEVWILTVDN